MRKLLTPELWEKLKDVKSSNGYTLSNAIQPGVLRPHLGVGITCGDEECFTLFKEIIYPVVNGWHKFDPESQVRLANACMRNDACALLISQLLRSDDGAIIDEGVPNLFC